MNFFSRLYNFIRGKAHRMMDQVERPEEQLPLFIEKVNQQVEQLHKAVATAVADEKRLKLQIESALTQAKSWEEKAIWALKEGDEALSKEALLKKDEIEQHAMQLSQSWETQRAATHSLRESLVAAKAQVQEAKRKASLLVAQYRAAETKQKLAHSLGDSATQDGLSAKYLEQLNDKILTLEAQTETQLELSRDGGSPDLAGKFKLLENRQRSEEALQQLKARLAASEGGKLLSPGQKKASGG
jgi:phage shock protein A